MDAQEYPLQHFQQMMELAAGLKSLPAQVLDHSYSYEAFGSWWLTLRLKGVVFRIARDGREEELVLQKSKTRKPPYDWEVPISRQQIATGHTIALRDVIDALRAVRTER